MLQPPTKRKHLRDVSNIQSKPRRLSADLCYFVADKQQRPPKFIAYMPSTRRAYFSGKDLVSHLILTNVQSREGEVLVHESMNKETVEPMEEDYRGPPPAEPEIAVEEEPNPDEPEVAVGEEPKPEQTAPSPKPSGASSPSHSRNSSSTQNPNAPFAEGSGFPSSLTADIVISPKLPESTASPDEDLQPATANSSEELSAAGPKVGHAAECSSGLHPLNDENVPKRSVTAGCEHELNVCIDCLKKHIAIKMTELSPDQIECPTCTQRLDFVAIRDFADQATFEKYNNLSLKLLV